MPSITNIFVLLRLKRLIILNMIRALITVMMIDKTDGSTNKVAITKIAKENATIKNRGGNPSRYIANINELYTKAKPSSCCIIDNIAGKAIKSPAIACDFSFEKSVSGLEINFANANAVNILHNSAGCKLKPPAIGIQLFDPLISFPITNVASINNIPLANKILASAVKTLLSMSKIKMPMNVQKIEKYICLL